MCEMSFFGNSGEVQNASGICNLPINIINEKIYLTIWVWFLVMIVATVLVMLGQLCILVAPYLRYILLQKATKSKSPAQLKSKSKLSPTKPLEKRNERGIWI